MNMTLWSKALADARALLVWLMVLVFGFAWIFVWLSSKIELSAFSEFLLNALPRNWERISGVPFKDVATPEGRIAIVYVDPVILFALVVWAIARGSDIVAGELNRGTMELLLAQPVRRVSVYVSQAAVTTLGCLLLPAATWFGTWVGIQLVELPGEVRSEVFLPPAANLFGMVFFLAGFTSLLSSCSWYRARVIGLAGGFYIVSLVLKVIGRMAEGWERVAYGSFLTALEPQALVGNPEQAMGTLAQYSAVLIGLGLLFYIAGGVIFCRRDLPAPV
jgi:ABC-2 type transport system permease protein